MIKWFEKHSWISWIITILIAIVIFYLSSQSFEKGAPGPAFPWKAFLYHLLAFFFFAFFLTISMTKGNYKYKHLILIAVVIGMLYGISDELHQAFVPNRACTFQDFMTDSVGVMMAGVVHGLRINWRK